MRITFIVVIVVLAFLDAQVPRAIAQTQKELSKIKTSFIWDNYIHSEVQAAVESSIHRCDSKRLAKLDFKKMQLTFDTCIQPTISNFKFDDSVNEQFEEFWNSLDLAEPLGEKTLEFLRLHFLGTFCHHAPIILNCYDTSFDQLIRNCWGRFYIQNLGLVSKLLPSICVYNGTRLEGIMNTGAQICLKSYLNHFDQCHASSQITNAYANKVDYETTYCSILSCMVLLGNQSPCNANAEEDVSLQFILDHVQYLIGCKAAGVVNEISKLHEESCEAANIPYDPLKYETPLEICIQPFLDFADYLRHATNSTLEQTKHVGFLKSDVGSFTDRVEAICDEMLNGRSNCTYAIQDVMDRCYTVKHQEWNAFVAYFDTILQVVCQLGGAPFIELFKNGDLECLVNQIASVWECVNDTLERSERDICMNLGLLHSCSVDGLDACTNPHSFQIVNDTFADVNQHIMEICTPVLGIQHQNFQPILNAQQTPMNLVVIIVVPLFAGFGFGLVGYLLVRCRRNRRRASISTTRFET